MASEEQRLIDRACDISPESFADKLQSFGKAIFFYCSNSDVVNRLKGQGYQAYINTDELFLAVNYCQHALEVARNFAADQGYQGATEFLRNCTAEIYFLDTYYRDGKSSLVLNDMSFPSNWKTITLVASNQQKPPIKLGNVSADAGCVITFENFFVIATNLVAKRGGRIVLKNCTNLPRQDTPVVFAGTVEAWRSGKYGNCPVCFENVQLDGCFFDREECSVQWEFPLTCPEDQSLGVSDHTGFRKGIDMTHRHVKHVGFANAAFGGAAYGLAGGVPAAVAGVGITALTATCHAAVHRYPREPLFRTVFNASDSPWTVSVRPTWGEAFLESDRTPVLDVTVPEVRFRTPVLDVTIPPGEEIKFTHTFRHDATLKGEISFCDAHGGSTTFSYRNSTEWVLDTSECKSVGPWYNLFVPVPDVWVLKTKREFPNGFTIIRPTVSLVRDVA